MPRVCPRCDTSYDDESQVCWRCRVRLVARPEAGEETEATEGDEEASGERVWVNLETVYRAPDEFSALAVQRVLLDAEIESRVRTIQIPWFDGVMQNIRGYWGEVLVATDDAEEARTIVAEYLRSLDRGGAGGE